MATAAGGTHPTGMYSCFFLCLQPLQTQNRNFQQISDNFCLNINLMKNYSNQIYVSHWLFTLNWQSGNISHRAIKYLARKSKEEIFFQKGRRGLITNLKKYKYIDMRNNYHIYFS